MEINRYSIKNIYCNKKITPMCALIMAIVFGVILSPWSSGLWFLAVFTILNEILYYIFSSNTDCAYILFDRTGIIFGYIFGYILGRTLSCDNVTKKGVWPLDDST